MLLVLFWKKLSSLNYACCSQLAKKLLHLIYSWLLTKLESTSRQEAAITARTSTAP